MTKIDSLAAAEEVSDMLKKGAFLTTQADGKLNTMTVGWGSIGFIWGKPNFMVMVRKSRFTHELIEKSREFTVSIPTHDMKSALKLCGTLSGRDTDKFAAASLKPQKSKKITAPVIAGAGMYFECRVVYQQNMLHNDITTVLKDEWYKDNDWHTFYFGEIVAAYKD